MNGNIMDLETCKSIIEQMRGHELTISALPRIDLNGLTLIEWRGEVAVFASCYNEVIAIDASAITAIKLYLSISEARRYRNMPKEFLEALPENGGMSPLLSLG